MVTGELRHELAGASQKVDAPTFISGADARRFFGAEVSGSNQVLIAVDRGGFIGLWDVVSGQLLQDETLTPPSRSTTPKRITL